MDTTTTAAAALSRAPREKKQIAGKYAVSFWMRLHKNCMMVSYECNEAIVNRRDQFCQASAARVKWSEKLPTCISWQHRV